MDIFLSWIDLNELVSGWSKFITQYVIQKPSHPSLRFHGAHFQNIVGKYDIFFFNFYSFSFSSIKGTRNKYMYLFFCHLTWWKNYFFRYLWKHRNSDDRALGSLDKLATFSPFIKKWAKSWEIDIWFAVLTHLTLETMNEWAKLAKNSDDDRNFFIFRYKIAEMEDMRFLHLKDRVSTIFPLLFFRI